ncbi:hypothetical protein AWZ03_013736 [Drosophila navojoa]|uniref:Chromo shadow domain-containing protein n=1 Tax=Drosophila navojoa TaxID=7232 RepID=A0A484AVF8_DRONA|nr:hypothetical protein AWZ03_013736 [Drosophila navojoa]
MWKCEDDEKFTAGGKQLGKDMFLRNTEIQLLCIMAPPAKKMQLSDGTATPTPSTAGQSAGVSRRRSAGRLTKSQSDSVDQSGNTANNNNQDVVARVLQQSMNSHKKIVPTTNNGFKRGIQPECILTAFEQENKRLFIVKFKNRRIPEVITSEDLKEYAPQMLSFYAENLQNPDTK